MQIAKLSSLATRALTRQPQLAHELSHTVQGRPSALRFGPNSAISRLKNQLAEANKSEDKLGNFEIQDLMSQYNQAETLAANVMKKRDDTGNSILGKI